MDTGDPGHRQYRPATAPNMVAITLNVRPAIGSRYVRHAITANSKAAKPAAASLRPWRRVAGYVGAGRFEPASGRRRRRDAAARQRTRAGRVVRWHWGRAVVSAPPPPLTASPQRGVGGHGLMQDQDGAVADTALRQCRCAGELAPKGEEQQ